MPQRHQDPPSNHHQPKQQCRCGESDGGGEGEKRPARYIEKPQSVYSVDEDADAADEEDGGDDDENGDDDDDDDDEDDEEEEDDRKQQHMQQQHQQQRNKELLVCIKSSLDGDEGLYTFFKQTSAQLLHGVITATAYYHVMLDLFGAERVAMLLPLLMENLPQNAVAKGVRSSVEEVHRNAIAAAAAVHANGGGGGKSKEKEGSALDEDIVRFFNAGVLFL